MTAGRDFAGFEELLEFAEILGNLMLRIFAEQPRDRRAELTGWRIVLKLHVHFRRVLAGRFETHGAGADDVGLSDRFPREQRRRNVVDDFRIPFDVSPRAAPWQSIANGTRR